MTEFDAARSELVLARAVVLVEGLTEKLVLPFVFSALGHDVDQDAISIVEIAETAGEEHVVVLDPDFEAVAGLRGHKRKPERAWREFAERAAADMPRELVLVAERAISFVRAYAEPRP